MKIIVVVDVQNDFVYEALGSVEACSKMGSIIDRLMQIDKEDFVIFTRDSHGSNYLETQEGKNLPIPHCKIHTHGWEIADNIDGLVRTNQMCYINKPTFGSYELVEFVEDLALDYNVSEIELFGFCTDICVISNALMLKCALPEYCITVRENCCAGVTPKKHAAALEVMKSCQIKII